MGRHILAEGGARRRLSRRAFLQLLGSFGLASVAKTLAGCQSPSPTPVATPATVALPTTAASVVPTATLTPTATPTETLAPTATATLLPETDLFDESALTPIYVAHDPDVQGYPTSPPFDRTPLTWNTLTPVMS